MRRAGWLIAALAVLAVLAGTAWMETGVPGRDAGVPAEGLLENARERAHIPEDWAWAEALTDSAYAVLFYDPDNPADCCFRLFAVREGEKGYFARGGGDLSSVRDGAAAFALRDTPEQVVLSANTLEAVQVKTAGGTSVPVSPEEPFVLLLPRSAGEVTVSDAQGAEIPCEHRVW